MSAHDLLEFYAPLGLAGGFVALLVNAVVNIGHALWRSLWPEDPAANWNVAITDPDGIPIRQEKLSAPGVGRLITDIVSYESWRSQRPEQPAADWNVTITDPDGIPIRQEQLSARGVGRVITDINKKFYT